MLSAAAQLAIQPRSAAPVPGELGAAARSARTEPENGTAMERRDPAAHGGVRSRRLRPVSPPRPEWAVRADRMSSARRARPALSNNVSSAARVGVDTRSTRRQRPLSDVGRDTDPIRSQPALAGSDSAWFVLERCHQAFVKFGPGLDELSNITMP